MLGVVLLSQGAPETRRGQDSGRPKGLAERCDLQAPVGQAFCTAALCSRAVSVKAEEASGGGRVPLMTVRGAEVASVHCRHRGAKGSRVEAA